MENKELLEKIAQLEERINTLEKVLETLVK